MKINSELRSLAVWSNFTTSWTISDEEATAEMQAYNNKILANAEIIYNHFLKSMTQELAEQRKANFLKQNQLRTMESFKHKKG